MNNTILSSVLLSISFALCAPAIAASAKTQPESKTSTQQSQQDKLEIAQHIRSEDLIGIWGAGAETSEDSLLNMTIMKRDGTGTDLMVFVINNPESSLKIKQAFSWQFDEKTQTFTQRTTDFATSEDGKTYKQDPSEIGKTHTAKVRMLLLGGKPDMLEFTDTANGEKISYFKQDPAKLREALQ